MIISKQQVIKLIEECGKPIEECDLPNLELQFNDSMGVLMATNNFPSYNTITIKYESSNPKHFRFGDIFLHDKSEGAKLENLPRIVIIGDIHCDYKSLSAILYKLTISSYDYFNNAYFVFLGDYIDRGAHPFQTLLLLLRLKLLLGNRCILQRGNHELLGFDKDKNTFFSYVSPAESIGLFNQYFKPETVKLIVDYFETLPFFTVLENGTFRYLLVHGGIPKDKLSNYFDFKLLNSYQLQLKSVNEATGSIRNTLISMLWGDPVPDKKKQNDFETRFEFGSEQFSNFLSTHNFTHLIRGHEPKHFGFERKYDGRLITVFSSGGVGNSDTYYDDSVLYPSFLIIDENGVCRPEAIFVQKVRLNQSKEGSSQLAYIVGDNVKPYILATEIDQIESHVPNENLKPYDPNIELSEEFSICLNIPAHLCNKLTLLFSGK